jgi:hypothetical protein
MDSQTEHLQAMCLQATYFNHALPDHPEIMKRTTFILLGLFIGLCIRPPERSGPGHALDAYNPGSDNIDVLGHIPLGPASA